MVLNVPSELPKYVQILDKLNASFITIMKNSKLK